MNDRQRPKILERAAGLMALKGHLRAFVFIISISGFLSVFLHCGPSPVSAEKTILEGVWHKVDTLCDNQVDRMIRFERDRYLHYRYAFSCTDTSNGQYLHMHINQFVERGTFELHDGTLTMKHEKGEEKYNYSLSTDADSLFLQDVVYGTNLVFTSYAGDFYGVDDRIIGE